MTTRTLTVPAQRGRILATDGSVLVGNTAMTTITADPRVLARQPDGGAHLLAEVARAVGKDPAGVQARAKPCGSTGAPPAPICNSLAPFQPIPIVTDAPLAASLSLLERPEKYPGIFVSATPIRTYPAGGSAYAQLVGYLAADPTSVPVGRAGLEQRYNYELAGKPGEKVFALGPEGLVRSEVSASAPETGLDVRTSIDPQLQRTADRALADGMKRARSSGYPAESGSVVVLDASNGRVSAMANQPTYDPSVWNGGITQREYDDLFGSSKPDALSNRAVSLAGPPASTFKVFSLFAAQQGGANPEGKYSCPSQFMVGNRPFTNFESASYGSIDIPRILEVSCDTVFYRWAYESWLAAGGMKADVSAPDPFVDVARKFGLGSSSGIDLPAEAPGRIMDRRDYRSAWEKNRTQYCRRATSGYPQVKDKTKADYLKQVARENCDSGGVLRAGDAVNFAIGQGEAAVTPLQLAVAYAALANGGTLYEPSVVTALRKADGSTVRRLAVKVRAHITMDPAMRDAQLRGLQQVVQSGTASSAFNGFDLEAHPLLGKTGTAEVYGKQATSWFASFERPHDGHQYVVVVRVEGGGEGGRTAAPIARTVWDEIAARDGRSETGAD